MPRSKDLPFSEMQKISDSGVFVKRFDHFGKTPMKSYAHRDDYYIFGIFSSFLPFRVSRVIVILHLEY